MEEEDVLTFITYYFLMGLQYTEILAFLSFHHATNMSMSTLKRKLKTLRLNRKKKFSKLSVVIDFLEKEIATAGRLCGYRWMHLRCIQEGLVVTQKTVALILKELDPVGVLYRSRRRLRRRLYANKGPNYVWHIDSYDKLRPYGIAINGAIDGFSRYILWLEAGRTASNPKVVGGYFLNTVKILGGCPRKVRFDLGTENVYIQQFQHFFRQNPVDADDFAFGDKSYIHGKSQLNQRIESWWGILRKHSSQFWMNLFEELKDDGHFSGSSLDKNLIQFCCLNLIQKELSAVQFEWNAHRIRKSRNTVAPCGRSIILFELPEANNTKNFLQEVSPECIDVCKEECTYYTLPCDTDVFELCRIIMEEKQYLNPGDPYEAVDLYVNLRQEIKRSLDV